MKKIIRHVLYKTQCQFCGTEFAFEKSDTFNRPTADNKKILPFTECPNCGKDTPATADKSTETTMQQATENANVSQIARMQRQIDQFDNLFLHLHQRIHQNCTCENVIISDIDIYKTTINEIIRIIDLHNKQK